MSTIGVVHLIFSFVAIGPGGWVVAIPKGTRWHRTLGHLCATSMVGVIATAFSLYRLTGGFGPFQVAALIGAVTLAGGMWTVLARRPPKHWIEAHAIWMSWSYIVLIATFVVESMTRFVMPRVAPLVSTGAAWAVFWSAVAVGSFGVFGIGSWLSRTRLAATVAAAPAAMRRERAELESGRAGP